MRGALLEGGGGPILSFSLSLFFFLFSDLPSSFFLFFFFLF